MTLGGGVELLRMVGDAVVLGVAEEGLLEGVEEGSRKITGGPTFRLGSLGAGAAGDLGA
jgi:hypothetical protein